MPNRILRDWTDSENIHLLSAEAERFFTRLIMKADDYGRYVANIKLLRATLFPLYEKLKEEKIISWLKECEDRNLVLLYEANGKSYLEIKIFDQKLKVRRSKYPPSNEQDRLDLIEGYVYIIGIDYNNPVKIGFSVNPWARLKEITANNHEKLEILLTIKGQKNFESKIHKALKSFRTKNEWFKITPDIINDLIDCSKGNLDKELLLESLRSYSSVLRTSTETETEVETKLKQEVEVEGKSGEPQTHTPEEIIFFKNFEQWVKDKATNVSKMKEPFTIDEYFKLKTKFKKEEITGLILKMGNYKPLLTKNISAYRTFLNWNERNYDSDKKPEPPSGPSASEIKARRILAESN